MPKPRIPKDISRPSPKVRPGMSESHLAMVRKLPCCLSGAVGNVEAHHLLRTGEHGMGRKSSDRWAIPVAGPYHTALHASGDEETFLSERGIDGRALATALWACRDKPDALEAMGRVVFRFRQEAERKRRAA